MANEENKLIAILPGAVTIHEPGFMKMISGTPVVEGDKIVFPFQVVVDFGKLQVNPGRVSMVALAPPKERE